MRGFVNFLLSGFGTNTMSGKAVGIVILICLIGFIAAFWVISFIWRLIKKKKNEGAAENK